jgi:hypothetical protein
MLSPAGVHPQNRIHQRPAVGVHRYRAFTLRATADGDDLLWCDQSVAQKSLRDKQKSTPPGLRILLGTAVGKEHGLDAREFPPNDRALGGHQGGLAAGGAQVDGKNVLVARRGQTGPNGG